MLSKICTDLETSKRLKELGIEGETEFYHIQSYFKETQVIKSIVAHESAPFLNDRIKAYTLEQILEMLPIEIEINEEIYGLTIGQDNIYCFSICYMCDRDRIYDYGLSELNCFATTAAKLLIRLKEDKMIKRRDKIYDPDIGDDIYNKGW